MALVGLSSSWINLLAPLYILGIGLCIFFFIGFIFMQKNKNEVNKNLPKSISIISWGIFATMVASIFSIIGQMVVNV